MELIYTAKRAEKEILNQTSPALLKLVSGQASSKNMLFYGDNLSIMKNLLEEFGMAGKIDLIYIDPPFSTNTVFKASKQRTQTISSSVSDHIAYEDKLRGADYIEFLRERLIIMRELMADHASIYVHIDYKIGHYVKVIMDEIFGVKNFRNDITRIKCNPKNFARKGYSNIKDMILFYTKTKDFVWHEPRQKLSQEEIERLFPKIDNQGRRYTTTPLHAPGETQNGRTGTLWKSMMPPRGRHWRYDPSVLDELDMKGLIEWSKTGNPRKIIYAEEAVEKGKRLQDIWQFKDPQHPRYPTEKNIDLLKTIITTSSNEGGLVLDSFCGSGTTLVAAYELGRHWIGIDNSKYAIEITIERIKEIKRTLYKDNTYAFYSENNFV